LSAFLIWCLYCYIMVRVPLHGPCSTTWSVFHYMVRVPLVIIVYCILIYVRGGISGNLIHVRLVDSRSKDLYVHFYVVSKWFVSIKVLDKTPREASPSTRVHRKLRRVPGFTEASPSTRVHRKLRRVPRFTGSFAEYPGSPETSPSTRVHRKLRRVPGFTAVFYYVIVFLVFCVVLCFYVLFVFVLCLVCPMLPVSLDCPILIFPFGFL
jgi:hypothetical protein